MIVTLFSSNAVPARVRDRFRDSDCDDLVVLGSRVLRSYRVALSAPCHVRFAPGSLRTRCGERGGVTAALVRVKTQNDLVLP